MIATAAAATSIDGFATVVADARDDPPGNPVNAVGSMRSRIWTTVQRRLRIGRARLRMNATATPTSDGLTRAHYIWTTFQTSFDVGAKTNVWPRALKAIALMRDIYETPETLRARMNGLEAALRVLGAG